MVTVTGYILTLELQKSLSPVPCPPLIISIQEIWEIKSEREELFRDYTVSTLGSTRRALRTNMGPRIIRIMGTDAFWKIRTNSIYSSHEAFKDYLERSGR